MNVIGRQNDAPYTGSAFFARKYCGADFLAKMADGTIQFDVVDEVGWKSSSLSFNLQALILESESQYLKSKRPLVHNWFTQHKVVSYDSLFGFNKDDAKNSAFVIQWSNLATAGNLGNKNRDQLYIQLTGIDK